MDKESQKRGNGSGSFKKLEDIFGQESLLGKKVFFKDENCIMSLGNIEEENIERDYVKTDRGYIYSSISWGCHYII